MKTIAIRGSAYAVGQQLGAFGREAWHTKIRQTALWQTVTALKTAEQTQRMRAAVQAQWPQIWQELEGMAEGLQAPVVILPDTARRQEAGGRPELVALGETAAWSVRAAKNVWTAI